MNWVLDSNIALYFLGGRLAEALPAGVYYLSVISEIELLSYPDLQAQEEAAIQTFLSRLRIVDLSSAVKNETIRLRRMYKLKLPDAVIAATILTLQAELLSNDTGLRRIPELACRALPLLP